MRQKLVLSNSYIQLNFSENVYSSYDNEPISLLDFELMFEDNNGFCDTLTMLSITDMDNMEINSGADIIKINFSTEAIIASGVETFTILVYGDQPTIFNESGVYMDPEASIGPISLFDLLVPTYEFNIDGQEPVAGDTIPKITFNEPIRNLDGSGIDNSNVDNHFTLFNVTYSVPVPFNASINQAKTEISVVPVDTFLSEHTIRLNMDANFSDLSNNNVQTELEQTFSIEADQIFCAIGQKFNNLLDVFKSRKGKIMIDENCKTSVENVWAGGDCVDKGEDLTVSAVAQGRNAAQAIHKSIF